MAEDIVRKILSEPDEIERMYLIRDNFDQLSEIEVKKCCKSLDRRNYHKWIENVTRYIIDYWLTTKEIKSFIEENENKIKEAGFLFLIWRAMAKSLSGIVMMLKLGTDVDTIIEACEDLNFDYAEIELLNEEDRAILIEKLGAYLPEELQERLDIDSKWEKQEFQVLSSINNVKELHDIIKAANDENKLKAIKIEINSAWSKYRIGIPIMRYDDDPVLDIAEVIKGMKTDVCKIKAIEQLFDQLEINDIIEVIKGMREEESKIEIVEVLLKLLPENESKKIYIKELYENILIDFSAKQVELSKVNNLEMAKEMGGYYIAELAKELGEADKWIVIEEYKKELGAYYIVEIAQGLSETNKQKVIIDYQKELGEHYITKLAKKLSEKNKILDVIKECQTELSGYYIAELAKELSEEKKIEAIRVGLAKLESWDIIEIAEGVSEENREKAIQAGLEKLEYSDVIEIAKGMSEENRIKAIDVGLKKLFNWGIIEIVEGMREEKNKLEVIEKYKKELGSANIVLLAKNITEENKIQVIKACIDVLNVDDFGELLSGLTYSEEVGKYFSIFLEKVGFRKENIEVSFQILNRLGTVAFKNAENSNLLSNESIELFGEENIYQLFKYFVMTGEVIQIENVLGAPEDFKKYIEYRKTIFEEKPMRIMDFRDAISEFNDNAELIQEVMNSGAELGPEEMKMFRADLADPKVKIEKKYELKKFPQKREEIISKLIDENSKEALIYLLTGLGYEEYQEKVRLFISDEQLTRTINEFDEGNTEFAIIKAINEVIELIEGMDEDKRKEVLRRYNMELAQEFTEKGSIIAKNRELFKDIEIKIRKIYGKELGQALKSKELPKAQEDETDKEISIIHLKGEEFKLLVHGIDAFGTGTGRFEKREKGKAYICTSLISNEHLARASARCYYGFDDIESNAMILEGARDIFSHGHGTNSTKISGSSDVQFMSSDRLIEESEGYNEIVLWREYRGDDGEAKEVWPKYVVCFGAIDWRARAEAKRLGIPIVLIEEMAYEKNNSEKTQEVSEEEEMPESYEETKDSMLDILRDATHKTSALSQQEAMNAIVREMEKALEQDKAMTH